MIKNTIPLSMAESLEYIEKEKKSEKPVADFIKKFSKISPKDAKELRKKLEDLKIVKMNDSNISKLIDILPEKAEEINKIFIDIGLDENETKKILDTIKEFK
jgi:DNA-directed RNA polymerase subunit F